MSRNTGILILFALILLCHNGLEAKRTRTTRHRPVPRTEEAVISLDSISDGVDSLVRLSGYEKTLRSRQENVYAANLSDSLTIKSVRVKIEYHDMKGRQLHSRQVNIPYDIPPGERRLLSFPTWDRQFVMYYRHSAPTRTSAQATAYDVIIQPVSVTFIRP